MREKLVGFDPVETDEVFVPKSHKKPHKKKRGGFQAMGLSFPVLKGIIQRGYKVPTPIQRKTIPVILGGRDVVGMARTGSGKTACFLIPLLEKLIHSMKGNGARALVLSPTRELALQTFQFIKEIGKFTQFKVITILGGDSMDHQFAAMHGNPDVIVATPGRLLHVCMEMELKLHCVKYVVFDEADRLFEMGLEEQLRDLVRRLPDVRQTVLFSATLPKVLVEFAKAGLNEPALIRLDVESKIPDELGLAFLYCRNDEKVAALLCLLKSVIPSYFKTLVFAATKYHVEYLKLILDKADISNTCIYSTLDSSARKINAAKFRLGKVSVLIVTDIAARGLDIPQLDCVINFNFTAKPKLFVHRVGRCARAGKIGTAYSLVSFEELPFLLDLYLFLGRRLQIGEKECLIGTVPPELIEEEHNDVVKWHSQIFEVKSLSKCCANAYKAYTRARPGASVDSVKIVKELNLSLLKPHPVFDSLSSGSPDKSVLLSQMKEYRPKANIFEMGNQINTTAHTIMIETKKKHKQKILDFKRKKEEKEKENPLDTEFQKYVPNKRSQQSDEMNSSDRAVMPKPKKKKAAVDTEYFIPYQPADHHTEKGFSVNSFHAEASKVTLDLTADSEEGMKLKKSLLKWDRKKKKFVGSNQDAKTGKIQTESGVWIPATYKTDKYAQWRERNAVDAEESDSDDDTPERKRAFVNKIFPNTRWGRHNEKSQKKMNRELKRPEQILKKRLAKEKVTKSRMRKEKQKKAKKNRR